MASANLSRILLHVKNSRSELSAASFKRCIFEQLGVKDKEKLFCFVHCNLENNKLHLELCSTKDDHKEDEQNCVMLKHHVFCPMKMITKEDSEALPQEVTERGVNVGVAVIVEAADEAILLTRRASHMRTFPGVWVPPGGHIELNESLEEAGLRELREETGLSISCEMKKRSEVLALWESVFPPVLGHGMPKRHHVVVYWYVLLDRTSEEMENSLQLNSDEVSASIWLPRDLTRVLVSGDASSLQKDQLKLKYSTFDDHGKQITGFLDARDLEAKMPPPGKDIERISTGTRYAMEMWFEKKSRVKKSNL